MIDSVGTHCSLSLSLPPQLHGFSHPQGPRKSPPHLNPQVPGDDVVRAPRLHLPVGGDGVHRQGGEGSGRLGHEDDDGRQQDAGLPHDERETDEEDHPENVLDAGLEDPLHRTQLALRGLLPAPPGVRVRQQTPEERREGGRGGETDVCGGKQEHRVALVCECFCADGGRQERAEPRKALVLVCFSCSSSHLISCFSIGLYVSHVSRARHES